ncbi:hypothetical protein NXW05_17160 [Phocaeicola vulgatus]|nr:hypothetical protein [Phocaeicola vulgatus]
MVSKNKNGGYSVASVSCRRMKTVGAVTTATTDGELKYSRDGAAEVPIGDGVGVASGNFTSSLKFVFYVNGQAVDVETVPMVVDGSDGKDGESITATRSLGIRQYSVCQEQYSIVCRRILLKQG